MNIKEMIAEEAKGFLSEVADEHRDLISTTLASMSAFTQDMLLDTSPENVQRQRANIDHGLNILANTSALVQLNADNRIRNIMASVVQKITNAALTAIAV